MLPMIKWGSHLSSRSLGKEVREEIKVLLSESIPVVIDFTGVHVVSHSFADEAFGFFLKEMNIDEFKTKIKFINASKDIGAMVTYALRERWREIQSIQNTRITPTTFCVFPI